MEMKNRIQEARKAAKLSQVDVAARLGKTQPTISSWEKGEYAPNLEDVAALCELLGVTPNQLLGIDNDELPTTAEASKPKGPYIACDDGEAIPISVEEENYLMKCLAKARDGQRNPALLEGDFTLRATSERTRIKKETIA